MFKFNQKFAAAAMAGLVAITSPSSSAVADEGREIGHVDTTIRLVGKNDKIRIVAFPDPDIEGVQCYLSRAETGGVKGSLGVAEDPTEVSIACRQTGPIIASRKAQNDPEKGQKIFDESRSFWFKTLNVVRHFDKASNCWTYLSYSDKIIDGSPKNAISAVCPVQMSGNEPIFK